MAHITAEDYKKLYQQSTTDPEAFWAEQADKFIHWDKPWDKINNSDYSQAKVSWFEGGHLNVSYNCLDRHLKDNADKTALIWEPDAPDEDTRKYTYAQLTKEVAKVANALKELGVKKGDRVCLYMPMIPEATFTMLACARLGAIHSVVFGGFSADALRSRVEDATPKVIVTADESRRGGKTFPLKTNVDEALEKAQGVDGIKTLVVAHTKADIPWHNPRDMDFHKLVSSQAEECTPVNVESTDPLFILYTSGSTGTPKGVVHGSGGYLLYAHITTRHVFDLQDDDVYWCTADIGWITGHTYFVYGPLSNGGTTVMYEGTPQYPDWSRWWEIIERHNISKFYTAPTAIRAAMAQGDDFVKKHDLSSLKILGVVGEPTNPEAYNWYHKVIGGGRRPIVDTWWQTETGGAMIVPLPYAHKGKPGSACKPYFGIKPLLLDEQNNVLEGKAEGYLCIAHSWPGQMQGVWNNDTRFYETYFKQTSQNYYFSGDGARRDEDGHYWITGRIDDVLNVSGHRLGSAEIESALVSHPKVSESAVVGVPHEVTGESVYAFVILNSGEAGSDALKDDLNNIVRKEIGAIAKLGAIQFVPDLPKTRSGKIMRRILRKVAHGDHDNFGDTSTLADPGIVDELIKGYKANKS